MDNRVKNVADTLTAPAKKHVTADSRNDEDHGLIADKRMAEEDRMRTTLHKLQSKENFTRGLNLKPKLRSSKHDFFMPESPSKRPPTPDFDVATNEQRAAILHRIDKHVQQAKKD